MPDLFQTGLSWLAKKLKAHASRTVYYHRKGLGTIALTATVLPTPLQLEDTYFSTPIEWQNTDYVILAADLVVGGQVILPERGDLIIDEHGGTRYTMQVMSPPGQAPYRETDNAHLSLRIHTKEILREAP